MEPDDGGRNAEMEKREYEGRLSRITHVPDNYLLNALPPSYSESSIICHFPTRTARLLRCKCNPVDAHILGICGSSLQSDSGDCLKIKKGRESLSP
jgi:hypothetical protein